MTEQHRITPPPSLVEQWCHEYGIEQLSTLACFIADKAAEWSSDQELEACCKWVEEYVEIRPNGDRPEHQLRAARRPKPPSLKQQALHAARIELIEGGKNAEIILRALEALPDE
jgi:hypothetical protein